MIGDCLELLLRLQLVASVAILALLGLRRLVPLDPDTRIWLWAIPLVAAVASLIPGDLNAWAAGPWADPAAPWIQGLVAVWLAGAAAALVWVAAQHLAFLREARRGRAGPAVVGVACQRIVMPSAPLFALEERARLMALIEEIGDDQ